MAINKEIAERLRKFGLDNGWTMAEYARKLDISPQQLNSYLAGNRLPGNKMKSKLESLGCNIIWLITGKYPNELQAVFDQKDKEEENIIRNLKLLGLDTWDKINEILAPTLSVAEKMSEYKIKKQKGNK